MNQSIHPCPSCGTSWPDESQTCQDAFYLMLQWEQENPELQGVHHLMVLCYHLQHPHLYSPDGLAYARTLLTDFVDRGISPTEVRHRSRSTVDSSKRAWKITARPGLEGSYGRPMLWTMTTANVVAGGPDHYIERVQEWARSMQDILRNA